MMKNLQDKVVLTGQPKEQPTNGIKESKLSEASRNVLQNHLSSFLNNDLNGVMSDYNEDSILITQMGNYVGLKQIEAFFTNLITHFPKQASSFEMDKMVIKDELAYIVWHAKTPSLDVPLGSDTFIFRNSKISQQTFVGELNFVN